MVNSLFVIMLLRNPGLFFSIHPFSLSLSPPPPPPLLQSVSTQEKIESAYF
jgi:hypothetical protein